MACARNIGLTDIPIVVVNADNYYSPFREQLNRSYEDELIKLKPHEVVHFVATAEEAVRWIEDQAKAKNKTAVSTLKHRASSLRSDSSTSCYSIVDWFRKSPSKQKAWEKGVLVNEAQTWVFIPPTWALTFVAGLTIGIAITSKKI